MSTSTYSAKVVNHKSKASMAQARLAWILLIPTIAVLVAVIIVPVFQSLYQSLFGKAGLDPETGFVSDTTTVGRDYEIGRASCRERV